MLDEVAGSCLDFGFLPNVFCLQLVFLQVRYGFLFVVFFCYEISMSHS